MLHIFRLILRQKVTRKRTITPVTRRHAEIIAKWAQRLKVNRTLEYGYRSNLIHDALTKIGIETHGISNLKDLKRVPTNEYDMAYTTSSLCAEKSPEDALHELIRTGRYAVIIEPLNDIDYDRLLNRPDVEVLHRSNTPINGDRNHYTWVIRTIDIPIEEWTGI